MAFLSTMTRRAAIAALSIAACGPGTGDATETGTDAATTADAPTTAASDDTDATGGPSAGEHGFACVRTQRNEPEVPDPFIGTARVRLTLQYDQCLIDFYKERPELAQTGPDGAPVFAAWTGELCGQDIPGAVTCNVEEISQTLTEAGDSSVYELAVTLSVADATQLEGGTLPFGPGPLAALAGCAPRVQLKSQSGAVGLDAGGAVIWQAESWGDGFTLFSSTGTGCVEVYVGAVG